MSYAIPYHDEMVEVHSAPARPAFAERSRHIWLPFLFPVLISAVSWIGGGVPSLTDTAFVILAALCAFFLCVELLKFPRRFGIGGILIFGGVLIWFCHDYFSNWFMHNYMDTNAFGAGISASVVARAAFYHCLFIMLMLVMLPYPLFRFVDRVIIAVPEPSTSNFYLGVTIFMVCLGWSAFFFTDEYFFISWAKGAFWFFMGGGPQFNVGRTGNLNYNWGGYVAQILQMGQIAGILGAFYALLIARSWIGKSFGWFCWFYWCSYSYTGERRGDIAFMVLPVIGLIFLKYGARSLEQSRTAIVSLVLAGAAAFGLWVTIQIQSADRLGGVETSLFRAAGNTMFSEGLNAWAVIPDVHGFAYDNYPGEAVVRPIPDSVIQFIVGPIPRALWNNKPGPDDFALWYSTYLSQDQRGVNTGGLQGTTVSGGAVGAWYFRYGTAGVIEGALFYGWLMGVAERAFRGAKGRPMGLLFSLGFATFMFRAYRDLWWHNLDPLIIAWVVLMIVVKLFFGGRNQAASVLPQEA